MSRVERSRSVASADVEAVRQCLERHPSFHHRIGTLEICQTQGRIVLMGTLPSYYLKQMLQEALRPLGLPVANHVSVISATGVSDIDSTWRHDEATGRNASSVTTRKPH